MQRTSAPGAGGLYLFSVVVVVPDTTVSDPPFMARFQFDSVQSARLNAKLPSRSVVAYRMGSKNSATRIGSTVDLALDGVPVVARHHPDRNRTSPMAFTGNKFEFRMPGADSALFLPLAVLLAALAEILDEVAAKLEAERGNRPLETALLDAFTDLMREADPVLFDGDCYSPAWHDEAARRGLPVASNTAAALEAFADPEQRAFLERIGIWSPGECAAFFKAKMDEYAKRVTIEARTMLDMVRTGIRPAAVGYQAELARRVEALGAARAVGAARDRKAAEALDAHVDRALADLAALGEAIGRLDRQEEALAAATGSLPAIGDEAERGRAAANAVAPVLDALRETCDALEEAMPRDAYPFPTCDELLQAD